MFDPKDLIEPVKQLGYGALLGAGLVGIIAMAVPYIFPGIPMSTDPTTGLTMAITVGAMLGAGCHRLAARFVQGVVDQVLPQHSPAKKRTEIEELVKAGRLSRAEGDARIKAIYDEELKIPSGVRDADDDKEQSAAHAKQEWISGLEALVAGIIVDLRSLDIHARSLYSRGLVDNDELQMLRKGLRNTVDELDSAVKSVFRGMTPAGWDFDPHFVDLAREYLALSGSALNDVRTLVENKSDLKDLDATAQSIIGAALANLESVSAGERSIAYGLEKRFKEATPPRNIAPFVANRTNVPHEAGVDDSSEPPPPVASPPRQPIAIPG